MRNISNNFFYFASMKPTMFKSALVFLCDWKTFWKYGSIWSLIFSNFWKILVEEVSEVKALDCELL